MRIPTANTPAALGYRMPAEWEPHVATWLAWPHNRESWPGKFEPVPSIWGQFARILAQNELVHILAGGPDVMFPAQSMVALEPNILLHDIPTNDAWMRDLAPIFLQGPPDQKRAVVNWVYNAWGGKYPPFDHDQRVPKLLAELLDCLRFEPGIVLEGGSIDVNGCGTLLTSEQCLLNPNRNPHLDRQQIEGYLADYLGVQHILWLGEGIVGDDTDGHVDDLARFVNPHTVVTVVEEDPADENYALLQDNLHRLQSMKDQDGRPLDVVTLPMPRPIYHDDQRLPASYANFYIANGVVVVPTFNDPADVVVVDTLQKLFPQRQIVGIHAVDLVWGLGAFHCISQQEPQL